MLLRGILHDRDLLAATVQQQGGNLGGIWLAANEGFNQGARVPCEFDIREFQSEPFKIYRLWDHK